jgi:hypothetical protein
MNSLEKILRESFFLAVRTASIESTAGCFQTRSWRAVVLIANFVNEAGLFHKIFKVGLEQAMCVKQSRSDGPFRDSEYLADFGMLETLYIVQSHHRAVVFGQLHHGRVQPFLQLMDVHLPQRDAGVGGGHSDELRIVLDARIYIVKTDLVMPPRFLRKFKVMFTEME